MYEDAKHSDRRTVQLRLAGILLVAVVLRVIFLGARSFWGDEIVSVKLATDTWRGFTYWILRREANMALYYLALRGWVQFGDGEAWVRLFSAVFGILTVPAIYAVGRRLYGERVAWVAALTAATNACAVQFSQEARSYSLLVLLVVLSYYYFIRSVQDESPWRAVLYVVISAAALYTHFFAALIILAQIATLRWLPAKDLPWRRLAAAYFVMAVMAIPIAIYILRNDVGQLYWVQPITVAEIYKLFVFFAGASKAVAAVLSVVTLLLCALAVAAFWSQLRLRAEASWRFGLVLTWAVLPPLIAALVSLHKPVFVHRYLLISLPGYLVLMAIGVSRLKGPSLIATLAVVIGLSGVSIAQAYFRPIEDWRGAVEYVLKDSQRGDALLVYIPYGTNNFNFYAGRMERKQTHPPFTYIDSTPGPSQVAAVKAPRTWLVLYPSPHVAELAPQFETALALRYAEEHRHDFKGVSVILFSGLKPPLSLPQAESGPHP